MPVPSLPASGNTSWYSYATDLHNMSTADRGVPLTVDPRASGTSLGASGAANRAYYARVVNWGTITGLMVDIGVSSGNIAAAVYSNTGVGAAARPGTRTATTGSIASPGTGPQTLSLGGSVVVEPGDWFCVAADNTTVTFRRVLNAGLVSAALFCQQDSAFPPPANASSLATTSNTIMIVGS